MLDIIQKKHFCKNCWRWRIIWFKSHNLEFKKSQYKFCCAKLSLWLSHCNNKCNLGETFKVHSNQTCGGGLWFCIVNFWHSEYKNHRHLTFGEMQQTLKEIFNVNVTNRNRTKTKHKQSISVSVFVLTKCSGLALYWLVFISCNIATRGFWWCLLSGGRFQIIDKIQT